MSTATGETAKSYLSPKELAEHLRVSKPTVLRMAREGMPHLRPSKMIFRFELDKCMQWIEARTADASASESSS